MVKNLGCIHVVHGKDHFCVVVITVMNPWFLYEAGMLFAILRTCNVPVRNTLH